MAEASFAKSFLAVLDARPVKLSADHVEDARTYPARSPYTLPRMPKPMSRTTRAPLAPGRERSLTVAVRSLRNPPLDVRLSSQPLTTSLLDIKTAVAAQARLPADRVRLLHRKKPVADSKVLRDLVSGDDEAVVELSVMVVGGGAAAPVAPAPAAAGPAGKGGGGGDTETAAKEVVEGEAFWRDLRGFLVQRVRDEPQADELFSLFLRAWEDR